MQNVTESHISVKINHSCLNARDCCKVEYTLLELATGWGVILPVYFLPLSANALHKIKCISPNEAVGLDDLRGLFQPL